CGSTLRFRIRRSPVFGEIGLPSGGKPTPIPSNFQPLVKYAGMQLGEPDLVFAKKDGTGLVLSPHPVRGLAENRPFDYPLTQRGFLSGLRLAIVCPDEEAKALHAYLQNANRVLSPTQKERDYLFNYPGFQSAYGVPLEVPQPGQAGWFVCPEPRSR